MDNNPIEEFINSLEYDVIIRVERRSIIELSMAIVIVTIILALFFKIIKS